MANKENSQVHSTLTNISGCHFPIQLRGKFLKCQHERWLLKKVKFSRVKSITDNTDIGLTFFPDQGAYIILSVNPRGI